jgi:succinyl-CoA synthetase alpha subunit
MTTSVAALDVLHAIAERFMDVQLESSRVHVSHDSVDAESTARREVDDDHPEPAADVQELSNHVVVGDEASLRNDRDERTRLVGAECAGIAAPE